MQNKTLNVLDDQTFKKYWDLMPEFLKRRRLEKAYRGMRPLIRHQLDILEGFKQSKIDKKEGWHVYVFNTVQNFWENTELVFEIRKKTKLRNFSFYPVRMAMETLFRFIYFCNASQQVKDEITAKEILRIDQMLYNRQKSAGEDTTYYTEAYKKIVQTFGMQVPPIDDAKTKDLDPFPDMRALCRQSKMQDPDMLYFFYRYLCELSHGKMIGVVIRNQGLDSEEYRRALSMLVMFSKEMLILVDMIFLISLMRKVVEPCLQNTETAIRGPLTIFERFILIVSGRTLFQQR